MKIWIGKQDVSDDLGRELAVQAKQRASVQSPRFHDPKVTALCLREAKNEGEFFETFMRLLRLRHGASTEPFEIQRAPGFLGGITQWVRGVLWKVMRYQHDRMIFQQNLINEMLIHAVEFEMIERQRHIDVLEGRLTGRPSDKDAVQ